jgi:glutathione gamma-glutamylcysteinyltransferase
MYITINFYRKSLQQTGTGHFGPIAAYNKKRDMVLLLDVAKFKY